MMWTELLLLVNVVQGSPSRTSSTTVDVQVRDINDNRPRFTQLFRASVFENAPRGTVVLRVTSTDADEADLTRYSLLSPPQSAAQGLFAIDPVTGVISVSGDIDREATGDVLAVRVAANDGAFNAETTVTIDILDENDAPPVCHLPSSSSSDAIQTVDAARLAVVVNVSATDADATPPNRDAVLSLAGRWSRDFVLVDGGQALAWRRPVPFQTINVNTFLYTLIFYRRITSEFSVADCLVPEPGRRAYQDG